MYILFTLASIYLLPLQNTPLTIFTPCIYCIYLLCIYYAPSHTIITPVSVYLLHLYILFTPGSIYYSLYRYIVFPPVSIYIMHPCIYIYSLYIYYSPLYLYIYSLSIISPLTKFTLVSIYLIHPCIYISTPPTLQYPPLTKFTLVSTYILVSTPCL